MRTFAVVALAALALAPLGCSSAPHVAADGTPLAQGFNPPGPPTDGMQLVSPIIPAFPSGGNTEFCYYTRLVLTEEKIIKAGQGFQTLGGHHVVIYWTDKPKDEQLKECTEDDMAALHVLTGGGAESGNGIVNGLPDGTAFHVPVGAQLVMNVHALNATPNSLDEQAVVNLFYGDASLQPVSSFYVTGTTLSIPSGETVSYTASCPAKYELKAVRLLGHMHEWGTENVIKLTPVGGQPTVVYDKPGAADFAFNPPFIDYPIATPVDIHVGDSISVTCTWMNPTAKTLMFPDEMCAAFGYVLGNDPEHGCADGAWNN
jgi:hypothetical protein